MAFNNVYFRNVFRYCKGDIPVLLLNVCEKYDCEEKPTLEAIWVTDISDELNSSLHISILLFVR